MFGWICERGGCEDAGETGGATLDDSEVFGFGDLAADKGSNGAREIVEGSGGRCHCCGR